MPKPIGSAPAAPSANAASAGPPAAAADVLPGRGEGRDQHDLQMPAAIAVPAPAPAMPVSAMTGAAAITQSARPATTGTDGLAKRDGHGDERGEAARSGKPDGDRLPAAAPSATSRSRSRTIAPQGIALVVAHAAVGVRLPRTGIKGRRQQAHHARDGPRAGDRGPDQPGRNHREVCRAGDAQQLYGGNHKAE